MYQQMKSNNLTTKKREREKERRGKAENATAKRKNKRKFVATHIKFNEKKAKIEKRNWVKSGWRYGKT